MKQNYDTRSRTREPTNEVACHVSRTWLSYQSPKCHRRQRSSRQGAIIKASTSVHQLLDSLISQLPAVTARQTSLWAQSQWPHSVKICVSSHFGKIPRNNLGEIFDLREFAVFSVIFPPFFTHRGHNVVAMVAKHPWSNQCHH